MSLLKAVGAEQRAIKTKDEAITLASETLNFESTNAKLQVMRIKSQQFLSEALSTALAEKAGRTLECASV